MNGCWWGLATKGHLNFSGFTTCIILMSLFSASLSIFADWSFLWQHVYNCVEAHNSKGAFRGQIWSWRPKQRAGSVCFQVPLLWTYRSVSSPRWPNDGAPRWRTRSNMGSSRVDPVLGRVSIRGRYGKITRNIGDLEIRTKAYRAAVHE